MNIATAAFEFEEPNMTEPDPQGRVLRDRGRFVTAEVAVVPPTVLPGGAARVHVTLRPNEEPQAHWNNEVEGLVLWVDPPVGWQVERRHWGVANPEGNTSREPRTLEFEVRAPENAEDGALLIPAYALYYVCEQADGACLYRRQDLDIRIEVRREAA